MTATPDLGYFGPDSVSWRVHRELTVLFGGARALLMQAAHPLIVAGANQTRAYERNPWRRLQRTLILTYSLTFGSKAEADAAAAKINEVHERINGVDPITGLQYDAFDPDLLLWVHSTLVDSALRFEEWTVGSLNDDDRQRFHEEQMLAAEMVRLPREHIPPTVASLRAWMADVEDSGALLVTEGARRVLDLFFHPPPEAEWRPMLRAIARLSSGTLPPRIREQYGIPFGPVRERLLRASLPAIRLVRPLLPPSIRYVGPYNVNQARMRGEDPSAQVERMRRSVGIRLGE